MAEIIRGKRIQFKEWDCELTKASYSNGRQALELVAWEDNEDEGIYAGEPIATCSVNIPEVNLEPNQILIKDYSENYGMLDCLVKAEVVKDTGMRAISGFVTIPICELLY